MRLASLVMLFGLVSVAHAAPGDLDTGFDSDGRIVETGLTSPSVGAVASQADGKVVVVGASAGDFAVLRYLRNGARDASFGSGGLAVTGFGGATSIDAARAVAIQDDGKIVVAGGVGPASNPRAGVARYNPNGSLDPTFSGDGIHSFEFADPAGGSATGVAIQADQKIVVVGSTGADFAAARLNVDGSLDTTFGDGLTTGIAIRNFGGANERALAVAILPDGRIAVAGSRIFEGRNAFAWDYFSSAGFPQFVSTPAEVNGAEHTVFGGTGVSTDAAAMAVQADGKILIVGDVTVSTGGGAVPVNVVDRNTGIARYNADGTMDTSFGPGGLRNLRFGTSSFASGVAVQPDGRIVVVGRAVENANVTRFAVGRLNANGTTDQTFSGDGRLTTDFSGTTSALAVAVAIQSSDGRIVAAGRAGTRLAVTRYHAFVCNGTNVTRIGTSGRDDITGTVRVDVIDGLGGDDRIDGSVDDDVICGGGGDDTLLGGFGNDTLLAAGLGLSSLNGGPGFGDVCLGSNLLAISDPLDTFSQCETINTGGAGVSGEWLKVGQRCKGSTRHRHCRLQGVLRVFNPGTETTGVRSVVAFYLSEDELLDEGDVFLTTEKVRALRAGREVEVELRVPLERRARAAGRFVIAVVDALDAVSERNEANNVAVSPPVSSRRAGRPH